MIGVSTYTGGYGDLPTGDDARRMADFLLEQAGFDYVHLLTEEKVTRDRVAELMSETFPALLGENDRFLFYWSGHGDTRNVADGDGKAGYLALRDTAPNQWSRMIAMRDVGEWDRFLKAKQSLFLLDSCFGGIAGTVTKNRPPQQAKIDQLAQSGHHVMSAGTETETTIAADRWGGSLFTAAVLDGLRGDADAAREGFPRDNIISLTELKAYVQDRVLHELQELDWLDPITPQVRDLRKNAGEFFFLIDPSVRVARIEPRGAEADDIQEKSRGTTTPTPEQIESSIVLDRTAVQRSLTALGYNPGLADGILGPRSRVNIRSWQSANGFDPTGYLTAEQHEKLLRDAEPRLAQAPALRQTPDVQSPSIEPAVGVYYEPLTSLRDCGECPEMVVIPSGAFFMGSRESEPDSYDDERPRHRVNVESFAIGKYEVTFDEWDACLAAGGCEHRPGDEGWGRGKRPLINVSWADAKQYVGWLSRKAGQTYRLPSEAEWEYAARAFPTSDGSNAPAYAFGDTIAEDQANFGLNVGRTTEIGSYPANAWNLHDMHGNVWELVEDSWHKDYNGAPADGSAWVEGNNSARVLRGGSWFSKPRDLRSALRYGIEPAIRNYFIGFRVARTLTP
ncbi:MAG: SUMF1/EgtB/PvdO family nonheme iron enzyme [Alphaproteobacteria bacterium]